MACVESHDGEDGNRGVAAPGQGIKVLADDRCSRSLPTYSQFYEWNPAVGKNCENLWPEYFYCVGVSGPATTIARRLAVPT
jgi:hypothetical protein